MSNSQPNPEENLAPGARPHRRLALFQSPQNQAPTETAPETTADVTPRNSLQISPPVVESPSAATVRVMAYLSADEARVLDETWLRLRAHPSRPSKSDILRAACTLATEDFDALTNMLMQQQSGTLSRQRSSKSRRDERGKDV